VAQNNANERINVWIIHGPDKFEHRLNLNRLSKRKVKSKLVTCWVASKLDLVSWRWSGYYCTPVYI